MQERQYKNCIISTALHLCKHAGLSLRSILVLSVHAKYTPPGHSAVARESHQKCEGDAEVISIGNRVAIIQNLEDAGCETEMIQDFLRWLDKGHQAKQLEILEHQREYLLDRVHAEERRISCLDYLIYQIQGKPARKRKNE